jgi:hypothetical protein
LFQEQLNVHEDIKDVLHYEVCTGIFIVILLFHVAVRYFQGSFFSSPSFIGIGLPSIKNSSEQ